MVDYDKFGKSVDRVQGLEITTIAGCHTPVLEGPLMQQALDTTREFPLLLGKSVEWDARIIASTGGDIETSGAVRFDDHGAKTGVRGEPAV